VISSATADESNKTTPRAVTAQQHATEISGDDWNRRTHRRYPGHHKKLHGGCTMITPSECRQRAADCRQMVERAPNARVQAILIDVARTWTRLALEAEHNQPKKRDLFIAGAPPEGPA
jgi:hypothetical protein